MRKIEEQMVDAVKAGGGWKCANTAVRFGARDCVEVFLHGNLIAQIDPSGGIPVQFTLAGWNTTTTRSRVNALLRAFSQRAARVSTCQGQAQLRIFGDAPSVRPIAADEWVTA